jgi:hypothetical protein
MLLSQLLTRTHVRDRDRKEDDRHCYINQIEHFSPRPRSVRQTMNDARQTELNMPRSLQNAVQFLFNLRNFISAPANQM